MKRLSIILAAALLGACGGSDGDEKRCNGGGGANQLEGSYCEDVEMLFTDVRVNLLESGPQSFLRIEYVRPLGTGLEKTLMVVFVVSDVMVVEGEKIPLLDFGGSVTRVLNTGSVNLTSELEASSTVQLDTWSGEIGSPVSGRVDLAFQNGRRLSGTFEATLTDAMPAM